MESQETHKANQGKRVKDMIEFLEKPSQMEIETEIVSGKLNEMSRDMKRNDMRYKKKLVMKD